MVTFAQDGSALQSGMPRSAIDAGWVDFVLPAEEIARELVRIGKHPYVGPRADLSEKDGPSLNLILDLLERNSGVDFTNYKTKTLGRRVSRRMLLRHTTSVDEYLEELRQKPAELDALYQDILINVTSFFRNPEDLEALKEKVFPRLIEGRARQDTVRVWTIACSTGEEAYSIAMAWTEFSEAVGSKIPIQVFATDLNEAGITTARAGVYPLDIAQDVSPERLKRFFVEVDGHYRISREIRDVCVFSRHNVLSDPPFSRIDLISCRNLLIYLERILQQKVIPTLHYALKTGGTLWLGSSETIGAFQHLFDVEDARHRFYLKNAGSVAKTGYFPIRTGASPKIGRTESGPRPASGGLGLHREADRLLLSKFAPPSVLVSAELDILQYRGDTSAYLAPAPGKASLNLLKMLREGLVGGIRVAVLEAVKTGAPVRRDGLRVRSGEGWREVSVEVIPVEASGEAEQGGYLVLFGGDPPPASAPLPQGEEQDSARLARELSESREYMQSLIDQQEAINQDLQSASEEIQSSNEELQSINEELETSKEELQSSNEELATVNDELNNRNAELARANNDLGNLLDSTRTPIVMVGPDLRIRRYTPAAERLFMLSPGDAGRPILSVRLQFDVPDLELLLSQVMKDGVPRQREIQDSKGHWFSFELRPYLTTEHRIDGAVLMLVDVDRLKRAEDFTRSIVETVRHPLLVLDAEMKIRTANECFYQTFQVTPEETLGRSLTDLGNGQWDTPRLRSLLADVLPRNTSFQDLEVRHEFERVGGRIMMLNGRRLVQGPDTDDAILLAMEDVTVTRQLEEQLTQYAAELSAADGRKNEFLAMLAHELRSPLAPMMSAVDILRRTPGNPHGLDSVTITLERQVTQMARLVDDLLDVNRITRNHLQLDRKPMELGSLVYQALEMVKPVYEAKGQELKVTMDPSPIYLEADATRLTQVIGNLLNNAAKFTARGGQIQLTVEQEGAQALIRVQDDGIGMTAAQLPRIFDLFMQGDTSLERSAGGLGIGLSLVKRLVELHGGSVEARSPGLGQGSELIVRLPLLPDVPDPIPVTPSLKPIRHQSYRMLVVDDNQDAADSLAELLRLTGNQSRIASDGLTAVELAESFAPEVILLDIGLPKLNGYEVARRIRSKPWGRNVRLIALTGWGQTEHRDKSAAAGFDGHLVKPVNYDILMNLLDTLSAPK